MPLNIATNVSFGNENEGYVVDSNVGCLLSPNIQKYAKHSEIRVHLSRNLSG